MQTLINFAIIIGGFGTLGAVLWAVYTYRRSRLITEASGFREAIVDLVNTFDRLMGEFQIHIALTNKKLFSSDTVETSRLCEAIFELLSKSTNAEAFEKSIDDLKPEIYEWVLYSLDEVDLRRANEPQRDCYKSMQVIRGYLPVLYTFVDTVGTMIFNIYGRELHVTTIRDYAITTAKYIWEAKEDGSFKLGGALDVKLLWRSLIGSAMNQLDRDADFDELFVEIGEIVKIYSEGYLSSDDSALAEEHTKEEKVNLHDIGGSTITDRLIRIVQWKFGKSDPERLTQIVKRITTVENRLKTNEAEEDKAPSSK